MGAGAVVFRGNGVPESLYSVVMGTGAFVFRGNGSWSFVFRGNVANGDRSPGIPWQCGPEPLYSEAMGARALVFGDNGCQGPCNSLQWGPGPL